SLSSYKSCLRIQARALRSRHGRTAMRRRTNNAAGHTALRRTIFALLLLSLLHSLVLPTPCKVSAHDSKTTSATALGHAAAPARVQNITDVQAQAREAYGKVSLTFEANEGQTDSQVNFLAHAGGATIFLTATEAVFVQPGADAGQVLLKFAGAGDMQLDASGGLVMQTAAGAVRQQKPVVYQETEGGRQEIESGYVLKGGGAVGFSLGAYDASKQL